VNQPPNDVRNFIHKRIIGAIGGGLTGGIGGAIGGFARGGGSGRSGGQPISPRSMAGPSFTRRGPCAKRGNVRDASGRCVPRSRGVGAAIQRFVPGGASGLEGGGAAIMGQYGAAMIPEVDMRRTLVCLPGMVLGKDLNCYNKRDISNKEREWPRGTRPLGTPGEMAALRKAASFGRRMETTVKRMQKIGVLKKPSRGRRSQPRAPRQIGPGGPSIINVE